MVRALAAAAVLLCGSTATAQTSTDTLFPVRAFQIEGANLVPVEQITEILKPFTGERQSLDTLRRAVEAVEAHYKDAGWGAVRVQLPEQEIDRGIVRLRIIEARIGRVIVEGNEHFSAANIRASVPAIREGEPPRLEEAGASLALANESFAKRARMTLQRGEREGTVDAVLRVADDVPWRIAVSLDNSGTSATGFHRLGLIYQHANLWDRDHTFSAQYLTSPEYEEKVSIVGLGYKVPLYDRGDSIDAAYGRSNVDSGTVNTAAGNFAIGGRGEFFTLRYNLGLPRFAGIEQKLSLAQDWRWCESSVRPAAGGASLIPDLSSAPLSATYSLASPEGEQTWRASLGYVENLPTGRDGTTRAYNRAGARAGADARFQLWRWSLSATTAMPGDWSLRAEANGQHTQDLLISGEQFGIGGMDSIRGFGEREILNDQGYRGTVEVTSAPISVALHSGEMRLNFVAFHDFGAVFRNRPLAGESRESRPASIGVGMRVAGGRSFQLRTDVGMVTQAAGSKQKDDITAHVQMLVLF